MIDVLIRRPQPEEHDSVRAVVQTVVDEIYGGLWAPPPFPTDEENWHSFWVAVGDTRIIGVVRTRGAGPALQDVNSKSGCPSFRGFRKLGTTDPDAMLIRDSQQPG